MIPRKYINFLHRNTLTEQERETRIQKRCPYAKKIKHKTKMYGTMPMYVPCRNCEICYQHRAEGWISRFMLDAYKKPVLLLTATYDNDYLPDKEYSLNLEHGYNGSLSKTEILKFIKQLSDQRGSDFRYLLGAEYSPPPRS